MCKSKFFAKQNSVSRHHHPFYVTNTHIINYVTCKDRSIYVNVFTFLDFMWSLGALPDGKFIYNILFSKVTSFLLFLHLSDHSLTSE